MASTTRAAMMDVHILILIPTSAPLMLNQIETIRQKFPVVRVIPILVSVHHGSLGAATGR